MIEANHESDTARTQAVQTRDRIVAATRELVARKGKRGSTTREIADLAGVNEATLFRHFGNKESLILAMLRASSPETQMRETVSQIDGPIEDDLYAVGITLVNHLTPMIDMLRWSLVEADHVNSIFSKEAWRPQMALCRVVTDYLSTQVEAGTISGDADELASIFIGMIFSRMIAREKFVDTAFFSDTSHAVRLFVQVFLNGVRSK